MQVPVSKLEILTNQRVRNSAFDYDTDVDRHGRPNKDSFLGLKITS